MRGRIVPGRKTMGFVRHDTLARAIACGAKCASRQNRIRKRSRVFVARSQPPIASRETAPCYDECTSGALFEFNLRFPGQYFDRETGLHYNYFRDYDPQTGRYLQADPIGLAGGINPYIYAYDDPLRFVDPKGLVPPPICPNPRECPQPPIDPSPDGPKPSPQPGKDPRDPRQPRGPSYNCADVEPSLGACLSCCASRSVPQYARRPGSICQEECYRRWGITRSPESLACFSE